MKNSKKWRVVTRKVTMVVLVVALILPILPTTAITNERPVRYGTTFVYDDGITRLEIPGYIGTTGVVNFPFSTTTFNTSFHVFITNDTVPLQATAMPVSANYIIEPSARNSFVGASRRGEENLLNHFIAENWDVCHHEALSIGIPNGFSINRFNFTVANTYVSGWFDDHPIEPHPSFAGQSLLEKNIIVISSYQADRAVEYGGLLWVDNSSLQHIQNGRINWEQVFIPGLRELILAAKSAPAELPLQPTPGTTFVYQHTGGLFEFEVPNFIGTTGVVRLPETNPSVDWRDYRLTVPFNVFLVDDTVSSITSRVAPINYNYIIQVGGGSSLLLFDWSGWGGRRPSEYHLLVFFPGISSFSFGFVFGNTIIEVQDDWGSYYTFEGEYDSWSYGWSGKSYIMLTNSMADEFLRTGTMQVDVPIWDIYQSTNVSVYVDVAIPGLRELILAARSGETPTQTNQATNAPNLNAASTWAHDSINNAFNFGLIPQSLQSQYTQAATRAEFSALAVTLFETMTGNEITGRMTFNDTNDINVQKMGYLGVVTGVGGGNFAPNSTITREQAAVMIIRLLYSMGQRISPNTPTFADNASIATWAFAEVGQAQGAGIMGGVGDNLFDPQGTFTREQSIITMLRLFELFN